MLHDFIACGHGDGFIELQCRSGFNALAELTLQLFGNTAFDVIFFTNDIHVYSSSFESNDQFDLCSGLQHLLIQCCIERCGVLP